MRGKKILGRQCRGLRGVYDLARMRDPKLSLKCLSGLEASTTHDQSAPVLNGPARISIMSDKRVMLPHGARGIEVGDLVLEVGRDKIVMLAKAAGEHNASSTTRCNATRYHPSSTRNIQHRNHEHPAKQHATHALTTIRLDSQNILPVYCFNRVPHPWILATSSNASCTSSSD